MEFQSYQKPATLDEALAALRTAHQPLLLAGGTDVLVNAREEHRYQDRSVIDIYGLPELTGITETERELIIGAGVTHAQIAASPLVRAHCGVLSAACNTVGSLQIRNHATIGGNIANASPAADSLAALAILGAEVEIARGGQTLRLPLSDVIARPYRTTLEERDLILRVIVQKLPVGCRYNFYKLGRRRALAISRMTIATALCVDDHGIVTFFSMTMGATFPKPLVFPEINAMLTGKKPTDEDIAAVAKALSDKIPEIAGIRASTKYKQPVCRNLCERILKQLLGGESHA